jgi:hypothetical protein
MANIIQLLKSTREKVEKWKNGIVEKWKDGKMGNWNGEIVE